MLLENKTFTREVLFMCSTYISFSAMPEDLDALKQNSAMYYCRSCKKAFMKKNASECPMCGSSDIKARMS
jgi:rRNA maturation endonuclease Nob1